MYISTIFYKFCLLKTSKIGNTCKEANENGIYILHGNGMQFHKSTNEYEPTFKAIYDIFENVST